MEAETSVQMLSMSLFSSSRANSCRAVSGSDRKPTRLPAADGAPTMVGVSDVLLLIEMRRGRGVAQM